VKGYKVEKKLTEMMAKTYEDVCAKHRSTASALTTTARTRATASRIFLSPAYVCFIWDGGRGANQKKGG
jgi:hypothetical protein